MAWRLDPGTDVVFQLHMLPTGKPEPIQSSLGLFFAKEPPTKTPYMLRLGSKVIDIQAGDAAYKIRDTYRLPVDARLLSVYPHAHYLAREMKGTARLPDGRLRWLVHIRDWDFNWQDEYRYSSPISLPAGTTLEMEYTYDNSADNLRNPHNPPQRVVYGPQSSDEMGDLWLQVLASDGKGLDQLVRDHAHRELLADVEGYEKLVSGPSRRSQLSRHAGPSLHPAGRVVQGGRRVEGGHPPESPVLGLLLQPGSRLRPDETVQ